MHIWPPPFPLGLVNISYKQKLKVKEGRKKISSLDPAQRVYSTVSLGLAHKADWEKGCSFYPFVISVSVPLKLMVLLTLDKSL
jgi:hypothetical protein